MFFFQFYLENFMFSMFSYLVIVHTNDLSFDIEISMCEFFNKLIW